MIPTEHIELMLVEIMTGKTSKLPTTSEYNAVRERLRSEVDVIRRSGGEVDIPHEIPDATGVAPILVGGDLELDESDEGEVDLSFVGHQGRPGHVGGAAPRRQSPLEDAIRLLHEDKENLAKVKRRAEMIAETMKHSGTINVVDEDPRQFEVGGMKFNEAGHYDPNTREIQINARVATGDRIAQTTGIVAHEISHAQYHTVSDMRDLEHEELGNLFADDTKKYFKISGGVRDQYKADFEERFPASAAFGRVGMDSYMTDIEGGGREAWTQLKKDDGVSAYSRSYWSADYQQKLMALETAINETVAEIRRLDQVPMSEREGDSKPTPLWKRFADDIQNLSRKAKK